MLIVPRQTAGLRPEWFSQKLEAVIVGIGGAVLMLAPAVCLFLK